MSFARPPTVGSLSTFVNRLSTVGSATTLFFNDNVKLETSSSGVNITGITTTDDLKVTGVSTFTGSIDANGDLDVDGKTNLDHVNVTGVSTF